MGAPAGRVSAAIGTHDAEARHAQPADDPPAGRDRAQDGRGNQQGAADARHERVLVPIAEGCDRERLEPLRCGVDERATNDHDGRCRPTDDGCDQLPHGQCDQRRDDPGRGPHEEVRTRCDAVRCAERLGWLHTLSYAAHPGMDERPLRSRRPCLLQQGWPAPSRRRPARCRATSRARSRAPGSGPDHPRTRADTRDRRSRTRRHRGRASVRHSAPSPAVRSCRTPDR